ncbi:hypothetical protein M7I_5043 [Glarea lozoyensis 74030]|uniref:Uncharacterized protein n=1 Tax=Glarea lozoyensis (strain ATCC 74030 / MF5533) TaxID=1104152 RepID=H0EQT6_GLAL7|nr:hypothetical protein M7I_5043 [Glarea lozoyensis 74030]
MRLAQLGSFRFKPRSTYITWKWLSATATDLSYLVLRMGIYDSTVALLGSIGPRILQLQMRTQRHPFF